MKALNKIVKDGKVAVLYSPGFGAGWYTWNYAYPEILFDPAIVEFVEKDQWDELEMYVTLKYPDIYDGGLRDLKVRWLPQGSDFIINEYDGSESISLKDTMNWLTA